MHHNTITEQKTVTQTAQCVLKCKSDKAIEETRQIDEESEKC